MPITNQLHNRQNFTFLFGVPGLAPPVMLDIVLLKPPDFLLSEDFMIWNEHINVSSIVMRAPISSANIKVKYLHYRTRHNSWELRR